MQAYYELQRCNQQVNTSLVIVVLAVMATVVPVSITDRLRLWCAPEFNSTKIIIKTQIIACGLMILSFYLAFPHQLACLALIVTLNTNNFC